MHFNQLTPAQAERLALLLEELGESQQAIGKILRHGYESVNPTVVEGETNRAGLTRELGDVLTAMKLMIDAGDVNEARVLEAADNKFVKVKKYLHHQ